MNQILVTQKLYITPELKRKQKMYKIRFFISVFLICVLFSYYIYAESERNKSEEVSKSILTNMVEETSTKDKTTINKVNDVIIVSLDKSASDEAEEEITSVNNNTDGTETQRVATTTTTANEQPYTSEAILTISKIDISYPVLSETSEELLKISLNKYWGGKPNTIGNYCIVGHNYANGKLFGKLSQLEIGDTAVLKDTTGKEVTYEVYNIYIVDPNDVACTSQLTNGQTEMTLITCKNYGTQRLIVKCRKV